MPRACRRPLRPCLALLSLCLIVGVAEAQTALFSSDGYRIDVYRSPTPQQIDGASLVDTPALQTLLKQTPAPLLIDVYRRQWLHERFIEDQPHENLPGSHWLANTGDGELSAQWQRYFTYHLQRASHGEKGWPLVFYCRSDCWLSWNAVKRAHHLGYHNLYWYRDGIDAWQQAGLPLVPAQPQALP